MMLRAKDHAHRVYLVQDPRGLIFPRRVALGWSRERLGEHLGCSASAIGCYETGKHGLPRGPVRARIEEWLAAPLVLAAEYVSGTDGSRRGAEVAEEENPRTKGTVADRMRREREARVALRVGEELRRSAARDLARVVVATEARCGTASPDALLELLRAAMIEARLPTAGEGRRDAGADVEV